MTRFLENDDAALQRFWHPVARSEEVGDEPLGVQLAGVRWVLVRLDGELVAFRDRCPHRFAPLSAGTVVDGTLQCPYHGFRFASSGRCVEVPSAGPDFVIPKKADVPAAFGVTERYGLVWLAPQEPLAPILEIPEWDDPAFHAWHLAPRTTGVTAGLLIDNFIDASHFPYLHKGTFGAEDPGTPDLDVSRDGWRVTAINRGQPNSGLNYGTATALQTYEVAAPFSLRIEVKLAGGPTNTFLFFAQPQSATSSRLYAALAYDDVQPGTALHEDVSKFNDRVLDEDLALLTQYPDPRMPVDLSAEFHVKADGGTIAYRRLAADLVALNQA